MTAKDRVKVAIAEHETTKNKHALKRMLKLGELKEVQDSQNALLAAIVDYLDLKV